MKFKETGTAIEIEAKVNICRIIGNTVYLNFTISSVRAGNKEIHSKGTNQSPSAELTFKINKWRTHSTKDIISFREGTFIKIAGYLSKDNKFKVCKIQKSKPDTIEDALKKCQQLQEETSDLKD